MSVPKKSKTAKVLVFFMAFAMLLSLLAPTVARADDFNGEGLGNMAISDPSQTTLSVGQSAQITISPYLHMQYPGCMMPECPEICGEENCIVPGKGCSCSGTEGVLRNAVVSAEVTSGDASVLSIGEVAANSQPANTGDTADGTLTLTAAAPGTVTLKVTAKGHNPEMNGSALMLWTDAEKTFTITVEEEAAPDPDPAPAVTVSGTPTAVGEDIYFSLSSADETFADWMGKVNGVAIDGTALEAGQYTLAPYNSGHRLTFHRTDEAPIFANPARANSYTAVLSAAGYEDVTASLPINNYGAGSFQLRVVDGEGVAHPIKTYTKAELEEIVDDESSYETLCGMRGVTSFKAQGAYFTDLLKDAGISFGPGMTMQLRTNDSLKTSTENDPTDEDGYYSRGTFTYENMLGQPRYSFPGLYTDEALKNNLLNHNGGRMDETVRGWLAASEKTEVEPMLAYNYAETIYNSSDGASPADLPYSSLISNERSFRFLFGVAMDGDLAANETTTWSASYAVFGIDIIDPTYGQEPELETDIAGADVSGLEEVYTLNGGAVEPEFGLSLNGDDLVAGTDYSASYKNNTAVGTATVTFAGKGEYEGTLEKTFTIGAQMIAYNIWSSNGDVTSTLDPADLIPDKQNINFQFKFDGPITIVDAENLRDQFNIKIANSMVNPENNKRRVEFSVDGKDPTILHVHILHNEWDTPASVGIQTNCEFKFEPAEGSVIPGIEDENGNAVAWTPIDSILPTGMEIEKVSSVTGTEDTPASVVYKMTSLPLVRSMNFLQAQSSTDGVISTYINNGNEIDYFTIHSHNFWDLNAASYFSAGGSAGMNPTLLNDIVLTALSDNGYTLESIEGDDENNPYLRLTARDAVPGEELSWSTYHFPLRGDADRKFELVQLMAASDNAEAVAAANLVLYNKAATAAEVQAAIDSLTPEAPALTDIADAEVSGLAASYPYTGEAIEPEVTVALEGNTLNEGSDYQVAYKDTTGPGAATLTITGRGQYKGTLEKTYAIVTTRLVGYNLYASNNGILSTLDPTVLALTGQCVNFQLKFDSTITIADADNLREQIELLILGSAPETNGSRAVSFAVDTVDPTVLNVTIQSLAGTAQVNGTFLARAASETGFVPALTDANGDPVYWGFAVDTIMPTGAELQLVESTAGTADTPASATYKFESIPLMRGMNFLLAESTVDGATSTLAGGYKTYHSHAFTSLTPASYINTIVGAANVASFAEAGYTFEKVDEDTANPGFRLTANNAVDGEEIAFSVYHYPLRNNADRKFELAKAIDASSNEAAIEAANVVLYNTGATAQEVADAIDSLKEPAGEARQIEVSFGSVTAGGGNHSFRTTSAGDLADWTSNITGVSIDGTWYAKGVFSVAQSGSNYSLAFNRSDATPVFANPERINNYAALIKADGYEDVTATLTVINYGAESFQLRIVNKDGDVFPIKQYSWEDMAALAGDTEELYQTMCGMRGISDYRATGVYFEDLLEDAGVTFGPGMSMQLRTNDSLKGSENDSTTENGYYGNGLFTYENMLGQPRYYFPEVYTDETLKNNILNHDGRVFDDQVRTWIGGSQGTEVQPMLALYHEGTVFRTTKGVAPDGLEMTELTANERAFRYLFGISKDAENAEMISNETTTWSASYAVFGIDIFDDDYVGDEVRSTELTAENTLISGLEESYEFKGSPVEPSFSLQYTGGSEPVDLVQSIDYEVNFSANDAIGTATATINGIGNYEGSFSTTFELVAPVLRAALSAPAEVSNTAGTELRYTLTLENIEKANRMWFAVQFDLGKLEYDEYEGDFDGYEVLVDPKYAMSGDVDPNNGMSEDGLLTFAMRSYSAGGSNTLLSTSEEIPVVEFIFYLKEGADPGEVKATLVEAGANSRGENGFTNVSAQLRNTEVITQIVKPRVPYDIDGNGTFDINDIDEIISRYYLISERDDLWAEAAEYDITPNGIIDIGDIIAFYSLLRA